MSPHSWLWETLFVRSVWASSLKFFIKQNRTLQLPKQVIERQDCRSEGWGLWTFLGCRSNFYEIQHLSWSFILMNEWIISKLLDRALLKTHVITPLSSEGISSNLWPHHGLIILRRARTKPYSSTWALEWSYDCSGLCKLMVSMGNWLKPLLPWHFLFWALKTSSTKNLNLAWRWKIMFLGIK